MERPNMYRNCILATLLVFTLFLTMSSVNAVWWNDSYEFRAEINITNEGSSTLTNYPALLNITHRSAMQTDFDDIRFINGACRDSGSTELDYEIDNYTSSGAALVWLSLPSLPAAGSTVCMYYGNSSVDSGQNSSQVWSAYEGVWHFSDYGSTTDRNDSTGANNAAPRNYDTDEEVPGLIGRADEFDGSNDYLAIRNKNYTSQNLNEVSACVWFRTNFSGGSYNTNWAFLDFDRSEFFDFYIRSDDGRLAFSTDSGGIDDFDGTTTGLNDNNWHYGCAVYDGTDKIIYVNGVEDNRRANAHSGNALGGTTTRFGLIGDGSEAGTFDGGQNSIFYDGLIDDIQYGEFVKTEDWINQSYQMVVNQASFVSLGVQEDNIGILTVEITSPSPLAINFLEQNETFNLNATLTCVGTQSSLCGNISLITQYNDTSTTFDNISNSSTTPLWTTSLQPQSCVLSGNESCNVSWSINMTGATDVQYLQRVFAFSNYTNVISNVSQNLTTEISAGNVVAFNQSTASFVPPTKNTGNAILSMNVVSVIGDNTNIRVTCEGGDCGVITEGFSNGLDLNESDESTFNFFCDSSNLIGIYSALYNVSSDEYSEGTFLNVSCQILPVFGPISVSIDSPSTSTILQVAQNKTIDINASVSCNGICGDITAYLIYNRSFSDYGDGSDGSLTVSAADTVVNAYTYLTGNELTGQSVLTVADTSGFSLEDEIMIIQMQNGTGSGIAGQYELAFISGISGNDITISVPLENSFYSGTFDTTSASATQVVRIPQYTDVTVNSGASIVADAWNGSQGGIVSFRVRNTLNTTGYIDVSELGYRGGDCNGCGNAAWGDSGEGYTGIGSSAVTRNTIGGGGGYGPSGFNGDPGGGGGHATAGSIGDSNEGNDAEGGNTIGEANLSRIFFGGGAGAGGDNDNQIPIPEFSEGGGIVYIGAQTIVNARVLANGETGVSLAASGAGTSGSGAGGSIWLVSENITLSDVRAVGGSSVAGTNSDVGGAGGTGRVRIDYSILSGSSSPSVGFNASPELGITEVSIITSSIPSWTSSTQPQTCSITEDGSCQFNWTLNVTADVGTLFNVSVFFSSNYSTIENNVTENVTINVTDNVVPTVTLFTPGNDTKIIGNGTTEFVWYTTDDDPTINCNLYINNQFNQTINCTTFTNTSLNLTLPLGNYTWFVNVNDTLNNSINSSANNFTLINANNVTVRKSIEHLGAPNMYMVTLNVTNDLNFSLDITLYDFVQSNFTYGSFSELYTFINATDGTTYVGDVIGWNLTLTAQESRVINYSILSTNSTDYRLRENYLFGIE